MKTETLNCKQCGREIGILEVFPGGICLSCHAAKVDKLPLERPDFIGTISGVKKRTRKAAQPKGGK